MPIFSYCCAECDEITKTMHLIGEDLTDCPQCEEKNSLSKMLTQPFAQKKGAPNPSKTGDLTKKFIEENRKVLEQQKKEVKERNHGDS